MGNESTGKKKSMTMSTMSYGLQQGVGGLLKKIDFLQEAYCHICDQHLGHGVPNQPGQSGNMLMTMIGTRLKLEMYSS